MRFGQFQCYLLFLQGLQINELLFISCLFVICSGFIVPWGVSRKSWDAISDVIRVELLKDGNRWSAWCPGAFSLHWLCSMLWMWCSDDEICFRTWLFWKIGMIKDVDTGTNLVCEESRPNIRNGTPSQLIFHSHESDNREIERNIPVGKK